MPLIDLVDETYIVAPPAVVAATVHDEGRWAVWWPDLRLTPFMDRAILGVRWSVAGPFVGSVELWLEAVGDGVLVHHFQRLDPVGASRPWSTAAVRRERERRARAWKLQAFALKDGLEGARRPGTPGHPFGSSAGRGVPTTGG